MTSGNFLGRNTGKPTRPDKRSTTFVNFLGKYKGSHLLVLISN